MSSVCVHGLGYIGLPTAAMLSNYDFDVIGYDASPEVVERLSQGQVDFEEPELRAFVERSLASGDLTVSAEAVPADYHIICVPTPLTDEMSADLEYVRAAGRSVAEELRQGDTVILESTVPPGTTVEVLRPILEESGLTVGETFSLAHCPETVLPGNIVQELKTNDRVIGSANGGEPTSAVRLYESFVEGEIHTTDATTAEFVKLMQNTFRDVNIAFANEVARRCYQVGIDSRETIELANTHPRVDVLQPGPGVGGHCLPIDPYFLADSSEVDTDSLVLLAREVNDSMRTHVTDLLEDALGDVDGRSVAVLGVAYKGNVGDIRESPGLALADHLTSNGVDVTLTDAHVDDEHLRLEPFEEAVAGADAAVIVTDHDEYVELTPSDLDSLGNPVVVDTKGVLDRERFRRAGFEVYRV
jgi:UDP-N-acetyl-D-mannosaminuronic acid dehydrogenase